MKSNRIKNLESEIGTFIQQYKMKAHAGMDPNDRRYDRKIEKKIKKMDPEEFSRLMYGDDKEEIQIKF